ncbi:MAG: polyphosphate kinase 2 [Burkholderiaceae bacterium]
MSKSSRKKLENAPPALPSISNDDYEAELRLLQIELVKLQRHMIRRGDKMLILLEGRDAAGKDGSIKRLVEYMSPRETRVVALGKPSDRDQSAWYFQRYVEHLPVAEELVLFNRSWYNRAGVEQVMGFCTTIQYEEFMTSVPKFEEMLINSGIRLHKYYLDISKEEQIKRLAERERDPLKQWKVSPIDSVATKYWKAYSKARNEMFRRTHHSRAPWTIVRADDKQLARLNLIKDVLSHLNYSGKKKKLIQPDRNIVFEYDPECLQNGLLAR